MKFFCSYLKRQDLYERLQYQLLTGASQPDEILSLCRREKLPRAEQQLITAGVTSGHYSEALELARQIAHCNYEINLTIMRHILAPVLLVTLVMLVISLSW